MICRTYFRIDKMRKLASAFLFILMLAACSDDEGSTPPDPDDPRLLNPGELIATIDGLPFRPDKDNITTQFDEDAATLIITVLETDRRLSISVNNAASLTTRDLGPDSDSSILYQLGITDQTVFKTTLPGASGTLSIVGITDTEVLGTFSGIAVDEDNPNFTIEIENGSFRLNI